tara:strand:+ start:267 stop:452 length:186 start_codon:yes stop_codon:yes gene_type:complete
VKWLNFPEVFEDSLSNMDLLGDDDDDGILNTNFNLQIPIQGRILLNTFLIIDFEKAFRKYL